jgi:hypothetical protein
MEEIFRPKHQQSLSANKNRPVVQQTDLLAIGSTNSSSYIVLHCLVKGLPDWATG